MMIYLIHFERPLSHAQHYLGSSTRVLARLAEHAAGNGARITEVLWELGEEWVLAAAFELKPNSRKTLREIESLAKVRHCSPVYCPICQKGKNVAPRWTRQIPIPRLNSRDIRQWTASELIASRLQGLTGSTETHFAKTCQRKEESN